MDKQEYLHMYQEEEEHWWYAGMRSITLSILSAPMIHPNARILDVGCGTGFNVSWLRSQYGSQVTGIDYNAAGLEFCRRRGERMLIQGNAVALPFEPDLFDAVTAFDMLSEFADERSRSRALEELWRVLKPGGAMLIRVAAFSWLRSSHDVAVSTYHRFAAGELSNALMETGFEIMRTTYANTFLFPVAALWRLLKKAGLAPSGSDVCSGTRGNRLVNCLLSNLLELEAAILRNPRWRLWPGLSLLALARKPNTL
jgi:SAM-dependent methyltransferase